MTDSNINPPTTNTVPGTEATQSPGLIPEQTTQTTVYASAVDHLVDSMAGSDPTIQDMPIYTEGETAHQELMQDPQYAIATHEHTLNKFADLLEQIVARLNAIEEKLDTHISDVTGPDPNDPLAAYPEVQRSPGLTA
tara:strand:+ start:51 stop:461 length:411 start_codon:yes stop_codon:yes gene_type:complete